MLMRRKRTRNSKLRATRAIPISTRHVELNAYNNFVKWILFFASFYR